MSFSNETDFEKALIFKLTEIDNQWSKDVLYFKTEEELIDNWAEILFMNNNTPSRLNGVRLSDSEKKQLINTINNEASTPFKINQLLNGKYIKLYRDNLLDKEHCGKAPIYLFLFDKDEIAAGRSVYQIARQPRFKLSEEVLGERRGDLSLLINGLPLIHIELKRTDVPIQEACNQIEKYMKHGVFTGLFSFVQVFVAMNPEETVYFANPGRGKPFNSDYFFHWGDFNNKHINDWLEVANTFLSIPMAHRLIGYGTISDASDNTLKVMRSYQYHAAYKIYTRVLGRSDWNIPDLKGGYIYHTTGSGKTLTSFKCAQLIAASGKVDKIIFLMDRSELWKQTYDNYIGFSDGEDINDTENIDILKSKLKSDDKNQLIVTSIQKMSRLVDETPLAGVNEIDKIKSKKLVFIIDEAHRDVAGEMLRNIKNTYTTAMFFGFTGTPIMKENAKAPEFTTEALFGEMLHSYNILEGIRDFNVLGFKPKKIFTFENDDLKDTVARIKIGVEKDTNISEFTDEQFEGYQEWINKDMVEIEKAISSSLYSSNKSGEEHRKKVVEDILKHWQVLSYKNLFHHILATSSIKEAIEYYKLLKNNDLGLTVTAIFDPHTDNSSPEIWKDDGVVEILNDYNTQFDCHFTVDGYRKFKDDVCQKLAHKKPYEDLDNERDKAVNIVIVVNQLLTGFDSKWINVLYLDKVLEYEQYIQACSRTNRLFGPKKRYGMIRYYRKPYTMDENADAALKLYVESGYKSVFVSSFGTNLANINKNYREIKQIFENVGILDFSKLPSSEADKKLFANLFNNMNLYIERAIPELFTWSQKRYDTEDLGIIDIEIDEYTYEILKLRYSELPKSTPPESPIIYDVKPYLMEISSNEINRAYLESKFTEFIKDLSNGASKADIDNVLTELRSKFAVLSAEDQKTAEVILEDILSGNFRFDDKKSFKDYIDEYNRSILEENISKFCDAFGFDKIKLTRIMSYHLKDNELDRYNRFGKIMDTIDINKAKIAIDKIEHESIQTFRVTQKAKVLLKKFILSGGFDIEKL